MGAHTFLDEELVEMEDNWLEENCTSSGNEKDSSEGNDFEDIQRIVDVIEID